MEFLRFVPSLLWRERHTWNKAHVFAVDDGGLQKKYKQTKQHGLVLKWQFSNNERKTRGRHSSDKKREREMKTEGGKEEKCFKFGMYQMGLPIGITRADREQ